MKKICSKCKIEKDVSCFSKANVFKDGFRCWCKECCKEYDKEYQKNNPEVGRRTSRKWRESNPEKVKECAKEWVNNNRKKWNEYQKEWYEKNKSNPKYKLNRNIRGSVRESLRGNKAGKHWEDVVGYSLQNLMDRLSVNFQDGMSFKNYGEWHIDHRKPRSLFHFTSPEEQTFKDCWALANLQPLWARDNIIKSNKF